jgi:hypothetical protein
MQDLKKRLSRELHHKRLGESTGAIAGLAGAFSVIVGYLAARATPTGLSGFAMALHLTRRPLLLRLAPIIAGVAVAVATAAGLFRFYTWWVERRKPRGDDFS